MNNGSRTAQEDEDNAVFEVQCKYCAHVQEWVFEPDNDFENIDQIIKYDYEYICDKCGCPVRVNEALSPEIMEELGW